MSAPTSPAPHGLPNALARLDAAWTRLEVALVVAVTAALAGSLLLWVSLKGLSARTSGTYFAGATFRGLGLALLAGIAARLLTRSWPEARRSQVTWVACALGVGAGWLLRDVGLGYFGNALAWLQDGSALTLVGGLRGWGTRLTLWLALLGASLATAGGRHVSIDVVTRALGEGARGPLAKLGGVVAAAVCLASAWGFFDFIALDSFHASSTSSASERVSVVTHGIARQAFFARRQLALDARMFGKVVQGQPWDRSLTATEWNAWLDAGSWADWVSADVLSVLHEAGAPESTRTPLLSVPGEGSRGLLVRTLNLVIPFGLVMLALRFLLWVLRGAPLEEGAETSPVEAP